MPRRFFALISSSISSLASVRLPVIVCLLLLALILGSISLLPTLQSYLRHPTSLLSPLAYPFGSTLSAQTSQKQVIGFYPYWNLNKIDDIDFSALTKIYYFAVDTNPNGSFNVNDPGWAKLDTPEFQKLKDKAAASHIPFGVSIIDLNPDSIAQKVNGPAARDRLVKNTVQLMKDYDFQTLNIDLEYTGSPDDATKKNYTALVKDLTTAVKAESPNATVTLDAFSDSVVKPRLLDLKVLPNIVDQIIIMAYDFHRLNSISAGPVAPLFGKEKYEYDVTTAVADFLKTMPSSKILLGMPFYGYEWPVATSQKASFVIPSSRPPELSSYHRSLETAQEHNASVNFDDYSKSVWFSYYADNSGTWRQVWFENERSIGLKLDLANQAALGGIAIFALGYDGADSSPLWQTVKEKFSR